MIKKIISKMDNLAEKLVNYEEIKKFEKKLKKHFKKNHLDKTSLPAYIELNKIIFTMVNQKSFSGKPLPNPELEIAHSQILNRVYELNKEFLASLDPEYSHTSNALARQLIELYLISFQIKKDYDYANVLTGNFQKHKGFPPFRNIIQILEVNKEKVDKDYCYYSNNFHPKTDSFMRNLSLIPPDFIGRYIIPFGCKPSNRDLKKLKESYCFAKPYFGNRHLMSKGWKLITFVKNSAKPNSKKLIDDFMFYIKLVLKTIK